jgi:cytochrome c oxidase subunit 2
MKNAVLHTGYLFLQSMLHPSSQQAHHIYRLFNEYNAAAFSMLGFVIVLTAYICIKFAKRKGNDRQPAQFKGSYKMEALMIGIPALLVAYFFYRTITTMRRVEPAVATHAVQPDVIVTGHQFWWQVQYPQGGVTTANEVHLPVGKKLVIELHSADVIHSWWVPELGNKMDLVPGKTNYLTLTIDKPASYAGVCSEFCGAQHAWMRLDVVAQDTAAYTAWLNANAQPAAPVTAPLAAKGAAIFQTATCANCHQVQGTAAGKREGPDLTHLFSRKKILAGMLPMNKENLYKWISDPQAVKPGAYMPGFIFPKDTLEALVQYLTQLK